MTQEFLSNCSGLERFSLYLKHIAADNTEECINNLIAADGRGGFLDMVHHTLAEVSQDEKMRDLADSRAAFLFDQYFREKNARDEGRNEGYDRGYSEGHGAGYSEGHGAGYSEGHGAGYSEGHGAGYSEGHGAGYSESTVNHIKNIMKSLNCSLDKAMDILMLPREQRDMYVGLVKMEGNEEYE